MKLPAFDYACPATLAEAVALLGSRDEAKALAGGGKPHGVFFESEGEPAANSAGGHGPPPYPPPHAGEGESN